MSAKPLSETQFFTTGQIAKICEVAGRTAVKWIDRGLLPGFRLPGMSDRRVKRSVFIEFLRSNEGLRHRLTIIGEPIEIDCQ